MSTHLERDATAVNEGAVEALVAHVRRRVLLRDVSYACVAGAFMMLVSVAVMALVRVTPGLGLVFSFGAAIAGVAAWLATRTATWREPGLLALVESRQPAFRNLLVTARELTRRGDRLHPVLRQRVFRDAARIARDTPADSIVPGRDVARAIAGATIVLFASAFVWVSVTSWRARETASTRSTSTTTSRNVAPPPSTVTFGIGAITAVVSPPPYSSRPVVTLRDPARIDGMAGSRLRLHVEASGGHPWITFNDRTQTLEATTATGTFSGELTLKETGVLTVTTTAQEAPRVIAVTVEPDREPVVEIVAPRRDLMFEDTSARVRLVARAQDDLGLRSLVLRYTKVSGSGEQYEFDEGELPLALSRPNARWWEGRLERTIEELQLSPGDLFVYYAAATDTRPDSSPGEGRGVSDSYVIEIGKSGAVIAGGFAIPPDEDRFAISLNALIQKTERLHARRTTLAFPAFADAALALAVEQRMVRTEFLFTMGFHGHVQDEEVEAEHSHEIQEGRLENRGQAEMVLATRLMTWAERQLTAADTGEALKAQRGALAAVQRALSRHRYFLRTLPTAGEIDLSRRLTGDLSAARSARRSARERPVDQQVVRVRALLADLARLARALDPAGLPAQTRVELASLAGSAATRALALEPASAPLASASAGLTEASRHITAGRIDDALALVRKAGDAVLPLALSATGSMNASSPESDISLRGAFVDALRERGGSR
jgi:hypothetical protein